MTGQLCRSRLEELATFVVPKWVRGVWQRTRICTESGSRNDAEVVWIQTPTLYADIREPLEGFDSSSGLAHGFAGLLDVRGQVCSWQRPIDLTPGREDQGAVFRHADTLVEVGTLANYLEDYRLLDPAARCFAASRGAFDIIDGEVQFSLRGALDILVVAGPYIMHARRCGTSALRHGLFDASAGVVSFERMVGDAGVFSSGGGAWTVCTDDVSNTEGEIFVDAAEQIAP